MSSSTLLSFQHSTNLMKLDQHNRILYSKISHQPAFLTWEQEETALLLIPYFSSLPLQFESYNPETDSYSSLQYGVSVIPKKTKVRLTLNGSFGQFSYFKPTTVPLLQSPQNLTLNDYFDKIMIINLARDIQKRREIEKKMLKLNLDYEFFLAVDGFQLSEKQLNLRPENSRISNNGAYGCLLSHLAILKRAQEEEWERVLILEDDILIHKELLSQWRYLIDLNWEICYLGASQPPGSWETISMQAGYYHAKKTNGTFAYAIKKSAYKDLIQLLETRVHNVDTLLTRFQENHDCKVIYPNLMIADVTDSNIREERDQTQYAQQMSWQMADYF